MAITQFLPHKLTLPILTIPPIRALDSRNNKRHLYQPTQRKRSSRCVEDLNGGVVKDIEDCLCGAGVQCCVQREQTQQHEYAFIERVHGKRWESGQCRTLDWGPARAGRSWHKVAGVALGG